MAAEYILKEGNEKVLLCERGIRTFETAYRFTLDLMAVPVLKQMTHLPIVVDPSHAAGRRDLVESLSLAAAAAGADGIIVEVHPNPEEAICDGPQALRASEFAELRAEGRAGRADRRQAAVPPAAGAGRLIVAVVGTGLIGGSAGMAARRRLGAHVRGTGRKAPLGVELGALDEACPDLASAARRRRRGDRLRAGRRAAAGHPRGPRRGARRAAR